MISVTTRPLFTPRKDPVPIVQEAGCALGPVWTGAENLGPTRIRSPDRPARTYFDYATRPTSFNSSVYIYVPTCHIPRLCTNRRRNCKYRLHISPPLRYYNPAIYIFNSILPSIFPTSKIPALQFKIDKSTLQSK